MTQELREISASVLVWARSVCWRLEPHHRSVVLSCNDPIPAIADIETLLQVVPNLDPNHPILDIFMLEDDHSDLIHNLAGLNNFLISLCEGIQAVPEPV